MGGHGSTSKLRHSFEINLQLKFALASGRRRVASVSSVSLQFTIDG